MRLFWGMIAGAIIAVAAVLGYLHFKGQENAGSVQGPLIWTWLLRRSLISSRWNMIV